MNTHEAEHYDLADDDTDDNGSPRPPFWSVAVYLNDRAYGGPEEGGWYYDCYQRDDWHVPSIHGDRDEAYARAARLQAKLDENENVGRRPISSVLSTGRYVALVSRGYPSYSIPETRPHYE